MNKRILDIRQILALLILVFVTSSNALPVDHIPGKLKPFRVLVIIGDQWNDPASYIVELAKPTGEYSGYDANPGVTGANDFHHLVILLKSWGIPFDVVRLDQQFLDRYMFLDMNNNPRYGTIIWDVNQSEKLLHPDYSIITDMVRQYGSGLIALSDRISQPEIQTILGLKYAGSWESNTTLKVKEKYLIKPLQEHHAVLNINFVAGYVNDAEHRLEPTWNKVYIDAFGVKQDYPSSKRGYDKGVKLGVFEPMCHGLTHMQPDLVSDPRWYNSALDKERAEVGWYREFGDTRRNKEIPPAEQFWRMKTAKEWLTQQFGVVPLEFCPGGLGTSISYFGNTPKLAGEAGFGWCGWETGYLGKDMVIIGWKFFGTSESPLLVEVPPDAHDFGISREPDKFATVFSHYPNGRFMSMNEFIGYLHVRNTGNWSSGKDKLTITLGYDPHYCQYFETHSSNWNLEFSDWLLEEKGKPSIRVDGKVVTIGDSKIEIPNGTGEHTIEAKF